MPLLPLLLAGTRRKRIRSALLLQPLRNILPPNIAILLDHKLIRLAPFPGFLALTYRIEQKLDLQRHRSAILVQSTDHAASHGTQLGNYTIEKIRKMSNSHPVPAKPASALAAPYSS
jgi:hypothetical protein